MPNDALRKGRYSQQHQIYFITTITHKRHPFFSDFTTARLLVRELRHAHDNGAVLSLAWVIMPDHLHWLIQLNKCGSLARVLKTTKARSAITINRHLSRKGSLWQPAYYDRAIRKRDDIRQIARYIVANPLRAGLARHPGNYPHWDSIWMSESDKTSMLSSLLIP